MKILALAIVITAMTATQALADTTQCTPAGGGTYNCTTSRGVVVTQPDNSGAFGLFGQALQNALQSHPKVPAPATLASNTIGFFASRPEIEQEAAIVGMMIGYSAKMKADLNATDIGSMTANFPSVAAVRAALMDLATHPELRDHRISDVFGCIVASGQNCRTIPGGALAASP